MATRKYEIALDETPKDVTEAVGSAIGTGKAVRVVVDLAVVDASPAGRTETLKALDQIRAYIMEDVWPPA